MLMDCEYKPLIGDCAIAIYISLESIVTLIIGILYGNKHTPIPRLLTTWKLTDSEFVCSSLLVWENSLVAAVFLTESSHTPTCNVTKNGMYIKPFRAWDLQFLLTSSYTTKCRVSDHTEV